MRMVIVVFLLAGCMHRTPQSHFNPSGDNGFLQADTRPLGASDMLHLRLSQLQIDSKFFLRQAEVAVPNYAKVPWSQDDPGSIRGVVLDLEGKPIADVSV